MEEQLIESYGAKADLAATDSHMRKSDILESGVSECGPYMSDAIKGEWKQEALQARRRGSQKELVELSLNDLNADGLEGESLEEAVFEEMEEITQAYVDWFKDIEDTADPRMITPSLSFGRIAMMRSQNISSTMDGLIGTASTVLAIHERTSKLRSTYSEKTILLFPRILGTLG